MLYILFFNVKFLELCRITTNNDTVILDIVQQRYSRTDSHFLSSEDFQQLINTSSKKINTDPSNKFVYIRDFVSALKLHKARPRKLPLRHQNHCSSPAKVPDSKSFKSEDAAADHFIQLVPSTLSSALSDAADHCSEDLTESRKSEELGNVTDVSQSCLVLPTELADELQLNGDQSSQHCTNGNTVSIVSIQDCQTDKLQDDGTAQKDLLSSSRASENHIRRLERLLVVSPIHMLQ